MREAACRPDNSGQDGKSLTTAEHFAAFPVMVFRHSSLHAFCGPFSSLAFKELPKNSRFQASGIYTLSFHGMVVQKPKHVQSLSRQCGASFLKDMSTVAN